mmetsp:Transcript_481/g.877  ORF Transcript_481/g.877 Transcript_481/m.877 type:complete len:101 (+) Transcript_481:145-447(+)
MDLFYNWKKDGYNRMGGGIFSPKLLSVDFCFYTLNGINVKKPSFFLEKIWKFSREKRCLISDIPTREKICLLFNKKNLESLRGSGFLFYLYCKPKMNFKK